MLSIEQVMTNLRQAQVNVEKACVNCGRNSSDVTLTLATKTQPFELLSEVHKREPSLVFGENRAQELQAKWSPDIEWHFIGQLQTNKVKYVLDKVSLIHSLDRLELAHEIDKRARSLGKRQACLVEINMGSELTKGGVEPDEALDFVSSLGEYENIRVCGLMSVLPNCEQTLLRKYYAQFKQVFDDVQAKFDGITVLSCGMSHDYELAVEYGATLLRLGSAVFGPRA